MIQGSDDWLAFRAQHFGASECAAMLGLSKTTTRAQLLHIKHTGLGKEFSEWVQAHVLDHGHEVEALARPHVEALIGADLYPVTCSDGELSASCDGLTMDDTVAFEHKQWNEGLAALVNAGVVPDEHMPQCQQIMLVTGAQKVVFVVSDGTPEKMVHTEVLPDAAWFARIKAGWVQFARDLAAYVPQAPTVAAVAAPVESLPAVLVRMTGALTVESNLDAFGIALRAFIDKIPARPSTDQEFADTDAACKALKKAEEALAGEEGRALASMADVEQMRRLVADLSNLARTTRLAREKMVEARKLEIRTEEVQRGKTALAEFIAGLNATIGKPYMPPVTVDFGAAIKGLRSLDSVRAAIDQKLADAKIAANDVAGTITVNLRYLREHASEYVTLFPDTAQIVLKAPDDLQSLVTSRIATQKAVDEKREADQRERIRQEEVARLQREQEARDRESARQQAEAAKPAPTPAPAPIAAPASVSQAPAANSPNVVPLQRAPSEQPTLSLGDMNTRLGFTMNSAFVRQLGIVGTPGPRAGVSTYRESEFDLLCEALKAHVTTVQAKQLEAA